LVFNVHRGFIAKGAVEPFPVVIHFGILEEVMKGRHPGGVATSFLGQTHTFPFVCALKLSMPQA
jgi:hypothetical protein